MTTIAFDGRYLAADTLTHRNNTPSNMLQPKITVEGGFAYAVSGWWCVMVQDLIGWHQGGAEPDKLPKVDNGTMLVVELSSRRVWCVIHGLPYLDEEGSPFAIGSGGDYALGAIDAGLNAMEAVRIAAKRDLHTNDIIDFVDLEWLAKGVQRWDGGMPMREVVALDKVPEDCPLYRVDTDEEGNARVTLAHEMAHPRQIIGKADICTHGYVRRTCSQCVSEVAAAVARVSDAKANGHG